MSEETKKKLSCDKKGVLFVSANIDIKKIILSGNSGNKNQITASWIRTRCIKFNVLDIRIIGRIINVMDTSYEIACATHRIEAKNAYLELLAQPESKIP